MKQNYQYIQIKIYLTNFIYNYNYFKYYLNKFIFYLQLIYF